MPKVELCSEEIDCANDVKSDRKKLQKFKHGVSESTCGPSLALALARHHHLFVWIDMADIAERAQLFICQIYPPPADVS